MAQFFTGLPRRIAEVQSRCRRALPALAEAVTAPPESQQAAMRTVHLAANRRCATTIPA